MLKSFFSFTLDMTLKDRATALDFISILSYIDLLLLGASKQVLNCQIGAEDLYPCYLNKKAKSPLFVFPSL